MKAIQVAEWFLIRAKYDYDMGDSDEMISNLKLQKLLYYAQGCTLAITGKPLFEEEIQAWEHGPVVPEVYHRYKSNGKSWIDVDDSVQAPEVDKDIENILENVYLTFGQFSAWKLRNMTHEETPWLDTPRGGVISKDKIKRYFEQNYVE